MIVLELKLSFISVSNSQMKFMILLILLSLKNTPENVPLEYCLGSVSVVSQSLYHQCNIHLGPFVSVSFPFLGIL